MSEFIDSCEYLSIEQIIRLLIFCNDNDNKYLNSCNSELNPDDLIPVDCDYKSIRGMLKQVFDQDNAGNPCVSFCSTDNPDLDVVYVVDHLGNFVVDYLGNYITV